MSDAVRRVCGWVLVHGERPPRQSVRLRVGGAVAGTHLAESVSLPDGQFAVAVPLGPHDDSVLLVEALDSAGEVLGQRRSPATAP